MRLKIYNCNSSLNEVSKHIVFAAYCITRNITFGIQYNPYYYISYKLREPVSEPVVRIPYRNDNYSTILINSGPVIYVYMLLISLTIYVTVCRSRAAVMSISEV